MFKIIMCQNLTLNACVLECWDEIDESLLHDPHVLSVWCCWAALLSVVPEDGVASVAEGFLNVFFNKITKISFH
jgi:hypothetical protein